MTERDSLLEDLKEASASVYHKAITKMQLEFHAAFQNFLETMRVWGEKEMNRKGANPSVIDLTITHHKEKLKNELRWKFRLFMEQQQIEKAYRDQAISQYVQTH